MLLKNLFPVQAEWNALIFLFPVATSLFCMCSLLFTRSKTKAKNNLILLLLSLFVITLITFIRDFLLLDPPFSIYRFYSSFVGSAIAPIVYLYFASLIQPYKKHARTILLYFSPAIVLLLFYLSVTIFGTTYPNIYTWNSFKKIFWTPDGFLRFIALLNCAVNVILCNVLIFRLRKQYAAYLINTYSSADYISLKWINLMYFFLTLFGVTGILEIINSELIFKLIFSSITAISSFCIFIMGYNQSLQSIPSPLIEPNDNEPSPSDKYATLFAEIQKCMETDLLYLQKDLTLQDLAIKISTNRSYISKAINSEHESFYNYVNHYRIQHAMNILSNSKNNMKLSSVADMCGFKSYSVFCRLFKEKTGYMPGKFINRKSSDNHHVTPS